MRKHTLMWYIFAEDGENGIGFGLPYFDDYLYLKYEVIHQETLGL